MVNAEKWGAKLK